MVIVHSYSRIFGASNAWLSDASAVTIGEMALDSCFAAFLPSEEEAEQGKSQNVKKMKRCHIGVDIARKARPPSDLLKTVNIHVWSRCCSQGQKYAKLSTLKTRGRSEVGSGCSTLEVVRIIPTGRVLILRERSIISHVLFICTSRY